MRTPKIIFNIDRVKICLLQPDGFFDAYKEKLKSENLKQSFEDGFSLVAHDEKDVNDKDITVRLYLNNSPDILLGTFIFNQSKKYGNKCFFTYNTKLMYEIANRVADGDYKNTNYNFFSFPFYVFGYLGLTFNNVTNIEIACDTNVDIINRIRQMVSDADTFDMILLGKKVKDPTADLVGFWEYYQRSRLRKASSPTIYIHSPKNKPSYRFSLKVYDKARELAQSRKDKEVLTKAWDDMGNKIQRLEITVENEPFKRFFESICEKLPNRWGNQENTSNMSYNDKKELYADRLARFFYNLGMDENLRMEMFKHFTYKLLHFKLKNRDKKQISILDIVFDGVKKYKDMKKRYKK